MRAADVKALYDYNRWANDRVLATVERLTVRRIAYVNTKGERWEYPLGRLMQHVVNHSTYHRGQVTTLLRQLGVKPLATDLLVFHDQAEKGGR